MNELLTIHVLSVEDIHSQGVYLTNNKGLRTAIRMNQPCRECLCSVLSYHLIVRRRMACLHPSSRAELRSMKIGEVICYYSTINLPASD